MIESANNIKALNESNSAVNKKRPFLKWLVHLSRFGLAALFLYTASAKLAVVKAFAVNVSSTRYTVSPLERGCFGGIIASQLGVKTALRNLALLVPAAIVLFGYQEGTIENLQYFLGVELCLLGQIIPASGVGRYRGEPADFSLRFTDVCAQRYGVESCRRAGHGVARIRLLSL